MPVPAVTELARGWRVRSGGAGELATPTGMALITALSAECAELPPLSVLAVGVGAGSRDTPGRPNVVRVILGEPGHGSASSGDGGGEAALVLEANVDDLDPRLWPGVLTQLLARGAADAWLTPIIMKKGRPAHTLSVLCRPDQTAALREVIFRHTSTIGIRQSSWKRFALPRAIAEVDLAGGSVAIKIAHRDGVILRATPEFEDVATVAAGRSVPPATVLQEAITAAGIAGLRPGEPVPASTLGPIIAMIDPRALIAEVAMAETAALPASASVLVMTKESLKVRWVGGHRSCADPLRWSQLGDGAGESCRPAT